MTSSRSNIGGLPVSYRGVIQSDMYITSDRRMLMSSRRLLLASKVELAL